MESVKSITKQYNKLLKDVDTNDYYTQIDLKNRVNCYVCAKCGHVTKTKDVDAGCTPFMHVCEKCNELAKSTMYKDIVQDKQPKQEWYRPTLKQVLKMRKKNNGMVEHILRGGLDIRPIS